VQFECFAAGILLCLILHGRVPKIPSWQRLILIACSGILWTTASHGLHCGFSLISENPGSWSLIGGQALVSLGCVLLLLAFLGVQPKLLPGWAIYLGRISFGLYVYHGLALGITHHHMLDRLNISRIPIFPLKVILAAGLTIAFPFGITLLSAMLSYRYFETPFLKMKRRHAVIESQPIVGAG
jgi:peptidoglycan/LPS O-acetylase OafA/YrhL